MNSKRESKKFPFFVCMKSDFAQLLLRWYDPAARPMPWKGEKDPYFIWVSEVILHQTRVAQGWAYYQRFIAAFPTIESLAAASPEAVMQLWKGLGYYRRAEHLHAGAKQVVAEFGGKLPDNLQRLQEIKGIGAYSAAAIASFAWNIPAPAIDGNAARILSRVFCIEEMSNTSTFKKLITLRAEEVIDHQNPGIFNQAMMDLGATVCVPRNPLCAAARKNCVDSLPAIKPKNSLSSLFLYYAVFQREDKIWMRQRSDSGIYRNMYDFYLTESTTLLSEKELAQQWTREWNQTVQLTHPLVEMTQILSHRKLIIHFYECGIDGASPALNQGKWYSQDEAAGLPTPLFITKYLTLWGES